MPAQVVRGESKGSFNEFRERTIDAVVKMDRDPKKAGFYAAAICDSFGGFFRAVKKGSITDEFNERTRRRRTGSARRCMRSAVFWTAAR